VFFILKPLLFDLVPKNENNEFAQNKQRKAALASTSNQRYLDLTETEL
jgi:hypothetical protein